MIWALTIYLCVGTQQPPHCPAHVEGRFHTLAACVIANTKREHNSKETVFCEWKPDNGA